MADNVQKLFPCDEFAYVVEQASKDIEVGLILGYDAEGHLQVYGGGLIDDK